MSDTVSLVFDCPRCLYHMDAASAIDQNAVNVTPKPGDVGLCLKCGAPVEYRADGSPRWLTYVEVAALDRDVQRPLVQAMLAVVTNRPGLVRAVPTPIPEAPPQKT